MDARGQTLLPKCPHNTRRQQKGSSQRSQHHQRAEQNETGASEARGIRTMAEKITMHLRTPSARPSPKGGREGGIRDRHRAALQVRKKKKKPCVLTLNEKNNINQPTTKRKTKYPSPTKQNPYFNKDQGKVETFHV